MNTVLISVDSLRPDHLGQYGYDRDTFPVLDRLLDSGADKYLNAYANGTHSAESIPSFLRSRYQPTLSADEPSLPSALGDAGVATAAIHSNTVYDELVDGLDPHFDVYRFLSGGDGVRSAPSTRKRLFRRTFDLVRPTVERLGVRQYAEQIQEAVFSSRTIHTPGEYTRASAVSDAAIDWIDAAGDDFFMWVHYMDPHRPYGVSDEEFAFGPLPDREESIELMSKAGLDPDAVTDEERQRMVDWYDADIRYTSHHIDRLLDRLPMDDTAVVLTADHGDEFYEHGAYFHRNRPYDELIHVPLVVYGPETDGDTHSEQRQLVDLAPQICRWHGVSVPSAFQGEYLDKVAVQRVYATGSHLDDGPVLACRWDGWKLMTGPQAELYDVGDDPAERTNVAEENPGVVRQYERYIDDELRQHSVSVDPEGTDAAAEERLRTLGYLDDTVDE